MQSGYEKGLPEIPMRFAYMAGLIMKDSIMRFKMLIYRKTRGNAMTIIENMESSGADDITKSAQKKSIYVVIFQESEALRASIRKICESFSDSVYDIGGDARMQIEKLAEQEEEVKHIFKMTNEEITRKLEEFVTVAPGMDGSLLENYRWFVERERIIYVNLNMFKLDRTWFKGLCWCPVDRRGEVDEAITKLRQTKKVLCSNLKEIQKHELMPPTLFRCNDFLRPAAEIVGTYGVASYQEVNPALFTTVTFPFLFGVMFGDVAHGLIVLAVALYVCFRKDYLKATGSLLASAINYRYMLLLMGIFATFCGFVYNDFASIPLYIASSCFGRDFNETAAYPLVYNVTTGNLTTASIPNAPSCVYPFGIDPKWASMDNEIQFMDSYKMKISVIIGVLHMTLGVVLKGFNAAFKQDWIDFWCEFVPQLIFLVILFGYMDLMIIIKWGTAWGTNRKDPPSLITQMVNIFLSMGDPGETALYGTTSTQKAVNNMVLGIFSLSY